MFYCFYQLSQIITIKTVIQLLLIIYSSLLLNTKSCFVALCAFTVFWLYSQVPKIRKNDIRKIVVIFLVCVLMLQRPIMSTIQSLIIRFNALDKHYQDTLFAVVVSGRNYRVSAAYAELLKCDNLWIRLLIGNGFTGGYLCEMDIVDAFFFMGIIGSILIIGIYLYILKISCFSLKKDGDRIRVIAAILSILFSIIVGHVIFVGNSSMYLILFCIFNICLKNERNVVLLHDKHHISGK